MKTLWMFRHSIKDGLDNSIGPKGIALAEEFGNWLEDEWACGETNFTKVFCGPLPRTSQTALAFFAGLHDYAKPMPVIQKFGDDDLFKIMANDAFRSSVKSGKKNFEALLSAHPVAQVQAWSLDAFTGIKECFDQMEEDELAIGFGHSPIIELAAWCCKHWEPFSEDLNLAEMEVLVFTKDDEGDIYVVNKIAMPANYRPG